MEDARQDLTDDDAMTSLHVRRALSGDRDSLGLVVERLTPLLRAQAAYRIRATPLDLADIDDIVAEAWLVAMRRLDDLAGHEGRATPRLVKFLGTTILNLINHRLDALIRHDRIMRHPPGETGRDPLDGLAAAITGVVSRAARAELHAVVEAKIQALAARDREVIVLRGIEGLTNQEVADELGEDPNTVSHRYRRALERLRQVLPRSVFDELVDE